MAGKGRLIERVLSGEILMDNGMFSPSLLAARNLRQGRGTYEQMRKALIAGGAKEDELVWSGFDQRFRGQGQVTREDVQSFLGENTDLVEDFTMQAEGISGSSVDESELVDRYVEQMLDGEADYYRTDYLPERVDDEMTRVTDLDPEQLFDVMADYGWDEADVDGFMEKYGKGYVEDRGQGDFMVYRDMDHAVEEAFGSPEEMAAESLRDSAQYNMGTEELYEALGLSPADAGMTQYADYFTPGMRDYREDLFMFSDPYGLGTRQAGDPHWSGVADSTPLMHRRSADVRTVDDLPAFHVGELQSDWAQGARGKPRPSPQQEIQIAGAPDAQASLRQIEAEAGRTMEAAGMRPPLAFDRTDLGYLNGRDSGLMKNPDGFGHVPALDVLADQPRYGQRAVMSDLGDHFDHMNSVWDAQEDIGGRMPVRSFGFTDPDASAYPATDYLRANTSPDQGGLPLGPRAEHRMSDAFDALYGAEVDSARDTMALARQFDSDDYAAAPYTNKTERWVDYMLKRSLIDAAQGGDEFLTIGTGDMAKAMTGGQVDGQTAFYDEIVPRRLAKVIRQVDPQAEVRGVRIAPEGSEMTVPGVRITPEMRERIRREGLPAWNHPAAVLTGGGLAGMIYQQGGGGAPRAPWEND